MKELFSNINFEITHSCNQQCKYCYNRMQHNSKVSKHNPFSVLKRIFAIAQPSYITFTGGEPLLSKYLEECAIHTSINNAKPHVITNANTENKSNFDALISAGVTQFQITVNSHNPNVHDELSQTAGSWAKTMASIDYILLRGATVIPTVVLTAHNINDLPDVLNLLKDKGLATIMVNRYNLSSGKYFKELSLSKDLLNAAFSFLNSVSKQIGIKIASNVCTPHCIINPESYSNIAFGTCPADPKQRPITVDYHGNVRLCNHSPVIVGNIFNNRFAEMLYSDYSLRWTTEIPTFCSDCKLYDNCKGGCRAASEQISGNQLLVDPLVELI
ncbi:MAG: radical SAM/SPASM domain-containing protein [Bacteroidales bacterium]